MLPVARTTLAGWCEGIDLTSEQPRKSDQRGTERRTRSIDTQWKRRGEIARPRTQARASADRQIRDPVWVAGLVLHWGEGSKSDRRLELSNSEPAALRLFMAWTRRFHDPDAAFRAAINLHANNDEPGARQFWAEQLCLDPEQDFTKTFVKPEGTGHRTKRIPHGVCSVRMLRSTDAWITTMEWLDVARDVFGGMILTGR